MRMNKDLSNKMAIVHAKLSDLMDELKILIPDDDYQSQESFDKICDEFVKICDAIVYFYKLMIIREKELEDGQNIN